MNVNHKFTTSSCAHPVSLTKQIRTITDGKGKTEEGKKIKTIQITHKSNTMKRNTNNKIAERERERKR